jgi:hypothetical protein
MEDILLSLLSVAVPGGVVIAGMIKAFSKISFYYKAVKQAAELFEELKEVNQDIFDAVKDDPNRKELSEVLSGGIKKIKGLTGIK